MYEVVYQEESDLYFVHAQDANAKILFYNTETEIIYYLTLNEDEEYLFWRGQRYAEAVDGINVSYGSAFWEDPISGIHGNYATFETEEEREAFVENLYVLVLPPDATNISQIVYLIPVTDLHDYVGITDSGVGG